MCAKAKKEKRSANSGKLQSPVAVAQIVKSYNTNGEIVVKLTSDLLEDLDRKEPVFIYFDELPVPFFIEKFNTKGNSGAVVKLSTINDLAHSDELVKRTIFIEATSVSAEALEEVSQDSMGDYLAGFLLINEKEKVIGEITNYFNYPNNPCIEVMLAEGVTSVLQENSNNSSKTGEGKTCREPILLPFQEQFILAFDPHERIMQMQIPAGLIN